MSLRSLLEEVVPSENITVSAVGNVLSAVSFMHGIVVEDLSAEELDYKDADYEGCVLARVVKPPASA